MAQANDYLLLFVPFNLELGWNRLWSGARARCLAGGNAGDMAEEGNSFHL